MKMMSSKTYTIGAMLLGALMLSATPAHAIKKCKDADGKWHYGDVAVKACQKSKVTTLSGRGTIKTEKAAPKTEQELEAEEKTRAIAEAEKNRIELEEREKTRVLSVYETESDIDRQRDNQLYSVDSNIAVHQTYLESLQENIDHQKRKLETTTRPHLQVNIKRLIAEAEKDYKVYVDELADLKEQRKGIEQKFEAEKALYRKLTQTTKD